MLAGERAAGSDEVAGCALEDHPAAVVAGARAEVEGVIRAWGSPFCDGWETFTPDPGWPVPALR